MIDNSIQFFFDNKKQFLNFFIISLIFILFKSLAFIAPFGINSILNSIEQYGLFELGLNIGQAFMGVLSMGFGGGYAYFVVKKKKYSYAPIFHFHFIILTTILFLALIIFPSLLYNTYFISIVIGAVFANQVFVAAVLKLSNKNKLSIIVDTSIYIIMFLLFISSYFNFIIFNNLIWINSLLLYLFLITVFYHSKKINNFSFFKFEYIKIIYSFGSLIVLLSPLFLLLVSGTRIYIGKFIDVESVAIYSIFFRFASVSIILNRIFNIILFRKNYIDNHKSLDIYFSCIASFLFFVNIINYFLIPVLFNNYYNSFSSNYSNHSQLFILCLFQVSFWIHLVLIEPIIIRKKKMKSYIFKIVVCLSLFYLSLLIMDYFSVITLINILIVNIFFIFILFFGQQRVLVREGVFYKKTTIAHSVIGLLFILFILIN